MSIENPPKFLIVDDSATIRFALKTILEKGGYKVVGQQATGQNLLASIEQLTPDVVCLDYNLPDCNGLDLLKSIHKSYPAVSVILITGSNLHELESDAAEAGAAGFIHKPFTLEHIASEFQQVVHAQRLLAQACSAPHSIVGKPVRAKAVVADDSATMRMLLASILKENDVEVVGEACNGRQAVDFVMQHNPDFICLDIEMPVMNGLDALREIHAAHPAVKVLMITGNHRREHIIKASQEGACGYIVKPYRREKIVEEIHRLIDSR